MCEGGGQKGELNQTTFDLPLPPNQQEFLNSQPSSAMSTPFHLIASFLGAASPSITPSAPPPSNHILAIVFSKARPNLALQTVLAMLRMTRGISHVKVIFLPGPYLSSSSSSAYPVSPTPSSALVEWIPQTDFFSQVQTIITNAVDFSHVYFQVDDALFFSEWDALAAACLLEKHGNLLAVHSKLWPQAHTCRSALTDRPMQIPPLSRLESSSSSSTTPYFLSFTRDRGSLDFNYPIDLAGGLYRRLDLLPLLSLVQPQAPANPNLLELYLSQAASSTLCHLCPLSACLDHRVLSILAIHRVQTVFASRVINPVDNIDSLLETNYLNLLPPREQADSVHSGDFSLSPQISSAPVDVSVLIPFRNAEKTLADAVSSIAACTSTFSSSPSLSLEIILVDDASTDASAFIAGQIARNDRRVLVIHSPTNVGVARALNLGLPHCQGTFIARMDADDVSGPGRLQAQVAYLRAHPQVGILGTGAIIHPSGRRAPTPSSCPAFIHWSMYFYCPVVHPSICARRQVFSDLGNCYPKHFAEDYALYLDLVGRGHWQIDNLPDEFLDLNRSRFSVTASWSASQQLECAALAHNAAKQFVGSTSRSNNCSAIAKLSAEQWLFVQRDVARVDKKARRLAVQALKDLEHRVLWAHPTATAEDRALVSQDCLKRQGELLL